MPRNVTLLDLVCEISRDARTDTEVVDRVAALVRSGRVRLSGSFRDGALERGYATPGAVGRAGRGR